jgi:hypothetical protein
MLFPEAVAHGAAMTSPLVLARAILREHVLCFASVLRFPALRFGIARVERQ